MTTTPLPPVAPEVTAALVESLTPRLRKRLDAAVTKLAARPAHRDGDTVVVTVDDETELRLYAPDGTVTTPDALICACLLAPACVHRAAAACAAPVADPSLTTAPSDPTSPRAPASGPAPDAASGSSAPSADPAQEPTRTTRQPDPATAPGSDVAPDPTGRPTSPPPTATPAERAAADALWAAGAAVLEGGVDGAGAVAQAGLLRAAHTARLSRLPRGAGEALSVVTLLRAARSGDPSYRTAELATALAQLLEIAYRLRTASGAELAALRGQARRPYSPDGSLRLYGLFTEPVITDSGHGGARTWVVGADGRLFTVGDVAPGGAGRALGVADRAVRLGDTALTHRELGRAGLAVLGATVSPDGRLGAGKGVKAVAARGVAWTESPLAALWETPPAEQASRALEFTSYPEGGGSGLLFLDVELLGPVRESGDTALLARCAGGPTVRLTVADDEPALAHRDNLNLLAAAPGTRLRIIGRLVPAPHPRLALLACSHPTGDGTVDLGLDRLSRADLPEAAAAPAHVTQPPPAHSAPYLLERRVEQTVLAGRAALGMLGQSDGKGNGKSDGKGHVSAEAARTRRAGFPTAAGLLTALCASAAPRERDHFGRLLPADTDGFATQWLTAARYTTAVAASLCASGWQPLTPPPPPPPSSTPHTAPRSASPEHSCSPR
ncbi:hypothetical protein SSPIM334S_01709 [Streptomyces spiroverticillatus]